MTADVPLDRVLRSVRSAVPEPRRPVDPDCCGACFEEWERRRQAEGWARTRDRAGTEQGR